MVGAQQSLPAQVGRLGQGQESRVVKDAAGLRCSLFGVPALPAYDAREPWLLPEYLRWA
jgi:hypothetical protein